MSVEKMVPSSEQIALAAMELRERLKFYKTLTQLKNTGNSKEEVVIMMSRERRHPIVEPIFRQVLKEVYSRV